MATAIEIANMALGYVDADTIGAFSDNNERARQCTLYFQHARRRALRLGAWNCCSHRLTLPKDGTAPDWGFTNRWLLPPDFIRLIAIKDATEDTKWSVEDGYILSDLSLMKIKYVYDDADVSRFDPLLVTVMAYCLALDLVTPLAHSSTKKSELKDDMQVWLDKAGGIDGSERPSQKVKDTSWVRARKRGG